MTSDRLFAALCAVATTACGAEMPATTAGDDCAGDCAALPQPRAAMLRDNLRDNLRALMHRDAALFGQQRFNITGVADDGGQWLADDAHLDDSDAHRVSGRHPAVLGIDAWDLAIKPATWTPGPSVHALAARDVFARGGVVTMEWHMRGCNADDLDGTGFYAAGNEDCLCRLANDDAFATAWLDDGKLARLADALETHELTEVPIVFRPLHEMTGDWFWWGYAFWDCTGMPGATVTGPAAYRRVFRRMVDYLRTERGLDNLLIAYAPDKLDRGVGDTDEARYLAGYPGDDYVDVLGIDLYYLAGHEFAAQSERYRGYLELVTRLADERGKIAALTETGNYALASETGAGDSRWFRDHLQPLMYGTAGIRLAFALTWENRGAAPSQFYVPYPAHPGAGDFAAFAASPGVLMLGDAGDLYGAPGEPPPDDEPPAVPVCAACDSDPDGDGWGWELEASCTIDASCVPGHPACARCDSDPDGDGWGWELEASCVVPAGC